MTTPVTPASIGRRLASHRRWLAGSAAVGALAVALALSLSPSGGGDDPGEGGPALAAFLNAEAADYEVAESPAELARWLASRRGLTNHEDSDGGLVVRGTIEGFAPGRIYEEGPDYPDVLDMATVVMELAVDEVRQGELPAGGDGSVYVELLGPEDIGEYISRLERDTPKGTPTVAYVVPMSPQGAVPGLEIANPTAGRPAGRPLSQIYGPQGLYYEDPESGAVIQPLEAREFPGSSLEDFEPAADTFPPGRMLSAGT